MSSDLEKSKIEVVRDALKDVIDTIRALDRKASYMIAINFFIITSFVLTTLKINNLEKICSYNELINFFPVLYFFIAVVLLLYSYNPVSNPSETLTKEDEDFGKDKFFIFHIKDREKNSDTLVENYIKSTGNTTDILKILYIEILKVSKIRERKISLIKASTSFLFFGLIFAFIQIITFYEYSVQLFTVSIFSAIFYFICKR